MEDCVCQLNVYEINGDLMTTNGKVDSFLTASRFKIMIIFRSPIKCLDANEIKNDLMTFNGKVDSFLAACLVLTFAKFRSDFWVMIIMMMMITMIFHLSMTC